MQAHHDSHRGGFPKYDQPGRLPDLRASERTACSGSSGSGNPGPSLEMATNITASSLVSFEHNYSNGKGWSYISSIEDKRKLSNITRFGTYYGLCILRIDPTDQKRAR